MFCNELTTLLKTEYKGYLGAFLSFVAILAVLGLLSFLKFVIKTTVVLLQTFIFPGKSVSLNLPRLFF
jgi:hypothetical protein